MNDNKLVNYKQESVALGTPELVIIQEVRDKLHLPSRSSALRFIIHQWATLEGPRYDVKDNEHGN